MTTSQSSNSRFRVFEDNNPRNPTSINEVITFLEILVIISELVSNENFLYYNFTNYFCCFKNCDFFSLLLSKNYFHILKF